MNYQGIPTSLLDHDSLTSPHWFLFINDIQGITSSLLNQFDSVVVYWFCTDCACIFSLTPSHQNPSLMCKWAVQKYGTINKLQVASYSTNDNALSLTDDCIKVSISFRKRLVKNNFIYYLCDCIIFLRRHNLFSYGSIKRSWMTDQFLYFFAVCLFVCFSSSLNDDQAMGTHITLLKATDRSCPRVQFPSQW